MNVLAESLVLADGNVDLATEALVPNGIDGQGGLHSYSV